MRWKRVGCAAIGDQVYVVGGMREEFKPVETCGLFDLQTRTWLPIPPPSRPRISPELVAAGGKLYLVGGSSRQNGQLAPDERIEVYDPARRVWSVLLDHLPVPARHARALPFGESLLLCSTHSGQGGALHFAIVQPAPPQAAWVTGR